MRVLVAVGDVGILVGRLGAPVVAELHAYVDGHAIGVCTQALGAAHRPPVECPRLRQVFVQLRVLLELGNHLLELLVGAIHAREFHRLDVPVHTAAVGGLTEWPAHRHELTAHLRGRLAIHLLEQRLAAAAARILHLAGSPRVQVVGEGKHILGVGIIKQFHMRLLLAVVVGNARAVTHHQLPVLVVLHIVGIHRQQYPCARGHALIAGQGWQGLAGGGACVVTCHMRCHFARGGVSLLATCGCACHSTTHCCKQHACSNV